jgi:TolB protein
MSRLRAAVVLALIVASLPACHRRRRVSYAVDDVPVPVAAPAAPERQLSATGVGRALSRITSDPIDEVLPVISPNGDVVLFETRVWQNREIAQQTIVGVDPETGASRTLYTSGNAKSSWPTWVPDGSALVFASDSAGKPAIVKTMAAQPNAAISVIVGGEAARNPKHPSVSPDGRRVALQAEMRGKQQIVIVGIDGARLTILGEGQRPAWSPDGARIAFSRKVGDYDQIFLINPDGTNLVQLTNDLADNDNPAWSPNGRLVVFNSNRGWDRAGSARDAVWNLFALKTNGTGLIQLTDGSADTGGPCWGRDGWLYFHSNQAGSYDIWRMHPTGELEAMGMAPKH